MHKKMRQVKYDPIKGWTHACSAGVSGHHQENDHGVLQGKGSLLKRINEGLLIVIPPRLLSRGKVGQSIGFCLEVQRVELLCRLSLRILLVRRLDLPRI